MDRGIRPYVNAKFVELLPQRTTVGNTVFRKTVIAETMEAFDCSLASAATHYNHAFKLVKASNPELVVGLGRPEDKKGGRKKKVVAEVAAPAAPATPEAGTEAPAAPEAPAQTETPQGVSEEDANIEAIEETIASQPPRAWPFPDQYTKVTVTRKKDGVVVGEFTIPEAEAMVKAAKEAKKAALEFKVEAPAA
jgi:hypothetical protein